MQSDIKLPVSLPRLTPPQLTVTCCRDESDEDNCKMLVKKENYNKKVSPFEYDYVNDIVIPVDVKISVAVMDILSIQEIELVYVAKFRLLMEWYDYRLQYYNLKPERSNNLLSKTEIDNLWVPFAVFSNTKDSEFTKGDDDSEITITREGNFTESQDDFMDEINIFAGRENKITFQQVYSKTFLCQYELQLYPFDTQVTSRGVRW